MNIDINTIRELIKKAVVRAFTNCTVTTDIDDGNIIMTNHTSRTKYKIKVEDY